MFACLRNHHIVKGGLKIIHDPRISQDRHIGQENFSRDGYHEPADHEAADGWRRRPRCTLRSVDVSPRGAATGVKVHAGRRDDETTRADRTVQTCVSMHYRLCLLYMLEGRVKGRLVPKGRGGKHVNVC